MGLCQSVFAAAFQPDERDTAQAVCMAESGGDPNAWCHNCVPGVAEDSRGLGQVNVNVWGTQFDPDSLFDPAYNATAARHIRDVQGWTAWATYKHGAFRRFLGAPLEAIEDQPPIASPIFATMQQQGMSLALLAAAAVAAYLLTDD